MLKPRVANDLLKVACKWPALIFVPKPGSYEFDSLTTGPLTIPFALLSQVFSGVFADDPLFICEVMQQAIELIDQQGAKKTGKERQIATLNHCGHVFDVITCRHRLIDAAWETEILSKVSCCLIPFQLKLILFFMVLLLFCTELFGLHFIYICKENVSSVQLNTIFYVCCFWWQNAVTNVLVHARLYRKFQSSVVIPLHLRHLIMHRHCSYIPLATFLFYECWIHWKIV